MKTTITIPMGSQHIALLEPLHFRFTTENEKIVGVEADVGYVHRGIEKACQTEFGFRQVSYVVGRVCGLCAISHSTAYSCAVEQILEVEVPKRAKYLRILVLELDRLHSHLLCLAHQAENSGFEALFMTLMRDRETVMEALETVTGNRVQFDYACVGGVNRDINKEISDDLRVRLKAVRRRVDEINEMFLNNWSLSLKWKGVGTLTKETAMRLNAVGPLARASGLEIDVRNETNDFLPYVELGFKTIIEHSGDVHARSVVRLQEMYNSIKILENLLDGIPEGEFQTTVRGMPKGDASYRLEAPRGELFYFVRGAGKQVLDRVKIKAPTHSNIPAFVEIFKGQDYANVPAILASLDPCLSCTAR